MSYTSVRLTFGAGIEDSYQWTDQQRAEAEACDNEDCGCRGDYLDHARHLLTAAMLAAGQAFIEQRPEMYRLIV